MPTPVKSALDGVTCDSGELEQVERAIPAGLGKVPRDLVRNFPHTKRVGSYLVGKMINKGSFAKVMEGMHISTGEKVRLRHTNTLLSINGITSHAKTCQSMLC